MIASRLKMENIQEILDSKKQQTKVHSQQPIVNGQLSTRAETMSILQSENIEEISADSIQQSSFYSKVSSQQSATVNNQQSTVKK